MANFIVAIELGSSKITGVAGEKYGGGIKVLAVAREDAGQCIHKGVVYNVDKTRERLISIIGKLKKALKTDITQVYVGVGGMSLQSVRNVIVKDLPTNTMISQNMVNELMDTNRSVSYPDEQLIDSTTLEFKVDSLFSADPVGIPANRIEGNFLNIMLRKAFYKNLNMAFDNAGITIADMFPAPLTLADGVLTDNEKRSGCVLIDLGAETTTVAVFYKNMLRRLCVVPLGGYNITKDIATFPMDEAEAENLKLKYGSAFTPCNDIDKTVKYTIDNDRSIASNILVDMVEARTNEIIKNVLAQIPHDLDDKLLAGIVLTGGASNMRNIEKAFADATSLKIRTAKFVNFSVSVPSSIAISHDGTMNTVLSLLNDGTQNCAGDSLENPDLFGGSKTFAAQQPQNTTAFGPVGVQNSSSVNEKTQPGGKPSQPIIEEEGKPKADNDKKKEKKADTKASKIWKWVNTKVNDLLAPGE